ncbi:MAG TPA: hypothetical protein VKA62_10995 [Agromyces sp.]|nr:hypothetical protein [Agromyces sp.]
MNTRKTAPVIGVVSLVALLTAGAGAAQARVMVNEAPPARQAVSQDVLFDRVEAIRSAKQAEVRVPTDLTRAQTLEAESVREALRSRIPTDMTRAQTLVAEAVREALQSRASGDLMRAQTLQEAAVRESLKAHSGGSSVHELVRSVKQAESE